MKNREKAHGFSHGMNPVKLIGIPDEILDAESQASPPKPLSETGVVLAQPRTLASQLDQGTPVVGMPVCDG
ncbi:MAG: hypothetical protein SXQ77_08905 [Halobacteria archaeon]|nr:hypothetical protein [Halobacteria archaeon]